MRIQIYKGDHTKTIIQFCIDVEFQGISVHLVMIDMKVNQEMIIDIGIQL